MEIYTPILRKKCVCKYCNHSSCSKCIERYLIDRHDDAHCLNCRVNYNDNTLNEICTKTYLKNVYFKHRQEVLINRERANLPGLQDAAIDQRKKRVNDAKIAEIRVEMNNLQKKRDEKMVEYNKLYVEFNLKTMTKEDTTDIRRNLNNILTDMDTIRADINKKREKIANIKWFDTNKTDTPDDKKKFIRRCTRDGCQGFLSTAWKCGICEYYSCGKCFKPKSKNHDDPHECLKEDVDTADLIKKDSKPCPNCGEFIMKSSGCFAANTPILMWNGTTKMSQDICIGDELVGDDGMKRIVLDTTSGVDTMYEVKQSLGMTYVVNSKHTLVLKYNSTEGVNSYIINKLKYYEIIDHNRREYHILVDDYMRLDSDIKKVLVGFSSTSTGINTESIIQVSEIGLGEYFGWRVNCNSKFVLNDFTTLRNCSQMYCVTCKTPWDWNTGKVVTSGIIHNPHYFEWIKRNGGEAPRNPADIPCGGFPNGWELRRMPKGLPRHISHIFFEFYRICMELQDISERTYRTHLDNDTNTATNIKFLLGDFDEKHWGQLLAKNERRRKRDKEVQEIFAAFRMVAVELINRIQNYSNDTIHSFTLLSIEEATTFLSEWHVETVELINMINNALQNISVTYNYSVPYINFEGGYYLIKTNNFSDKKQKDIKENNTGMAGAGCPTASNHYRSRDDAAAATVATAVAATVTATTSIIVDADDYNNDSDDDSDIDADNDIMNYTINDIINDNDDTILQAVIEASIKLAIEGKHSK
jgi:hypothetical protein